MGTPAYMAPEQIAGDDVDARADQFAFAIVLHEALCGERPFTGSSVAEVHAAIANGTPNRPPPGRRVPRRVRRVIERGLAGEPAARFSSVRALLDALERAQRRRAPALVAAVAAVVALGAVGVAMAWPKAPSCDDAGAEVGEVWNARSRADALARLRAASPGDADTVWPALAAAADSWAARYRTAAAQSCEAERAHRWNEDLTARARWCLNDNLGGIGMFLAHLPATPADRGKVPLLVRTLVAASDAGVCVDERHMKQLHRPPDGIGARVRWDIALMYTRMLGKRISLGQLESAEALVPAAIAAVSGTDDPDLRFTLEDVRANIAYRRGRSDDAIAQMTAMFDEARRVGNDDRAIHAASSLLGIHAEVNDLAKAAPFIEYLRTHVDDGGDPENKADAWRELAHVELRTGRLDEALGYYRRILKLFQDGVVVDVSEYGRALSDYGTTLYEAGDLAQARTVLTDAIARLEAQFGRDSVELSDSLGTLGLAESDAGDSTQAIEHTGRALAILEHTKHEPDEELAAAYLNYGVALVTARRSEEAITALSRARAIYAPIEGPTGRDVGNIEQDLGVATQQLGHLDEAHAAYERALAIEEQAVGAQHPDTARALGNLVSVLGQMGRCRDAIGRAQRALAIWNAVAPTHPAVVNTLSRLGRCEVELGHAEVALEPLEHALALVSSVSVPPYERGYARWQLARALDALHRDRDRATRLARDARPDLDGDPELAAAIDRRLAAP
jgi:tetratricopeptide (TPR) repeat protein